MPLSVSVCHCYMFLFSGVVPERTSSCSVAADGYSCLRLTSLYSKGVDARKDHLATSRPVKSGNPSCRESARRTPSVTYPSVEARCSLCLLMCAPSDDVIAFEGESKANISPEILADRPDNIIGLSVRKSNCVVYAQMTCLRAFVHARYGGIH